jgi:ANTAR domain
VQPSADFPETADLPRAGAVLAAGDRRRAAGPALAEDLASRARAVEQDPAGRPAASAVISEAAAQISQLHAALESREVIGQAKGILMERYRLTPDAAFALLARASQDTNVKLREVAAELCQTGALPGRDDQRGRLAG